MPGLDGTGPRALGPMTGGGRGLCVLKLPAEPGNPITGLAGRVGWRFSQPLETDAELEQLRRQARHIETVLRVIRGRIQELEACRPQGSIGA